jgi:hypothetical protein
MADLQKPSKHCVEVPRQAVHSELRWQAALHGEFAPFKHVTYCAQLSKHAPTQCVIAHSDT